MDFFSQQDVARWRTRKLVLLYLLSVVLLVTTVSLTVTAIYAGEKVSNRDRHSKRSSVVSVESPDIIVVATTTALITITIIVFGTISKLLTLSQGGEAVALSLGGSEIPPNSTVPEQRRLLNVIEEMSIASGVPVPRAFLLANEDGINAFAAGLSTTNAVIGVTQGCITKLTRDQLQGVIAHEFSHILNGDMRLNLRTIGLLHGIIALSVVGEIIVRNFNSKNRRSRGSKSDPMAAIVIVGFVFMVLGHIGVITSRLIKSAISRQREFLADASAVQFTRNPGGIAGALAKILAFSSGSKIDSPHTEESSHLFFSNALGVSWAQLFATHPPLKERIQRINPQFVPEGINEAAAPIEDEHAGVAHLQTSQTAPSRITTDSSTVIKSVGNPSLQHHTEALQVKQSIPLEILNAVRETYSARIVAYLLLLDAEGAEKLKQMQILRGLIDAKLFADLEKLSPAFHDLSSRQRLAILDLAVPALSRLSQTQYDQFKQTVKALVTADKNLVLFEYVLCQLLFKSIDWLADAQSNSLTLEDPTDHDLSVVISSLAWSSGRNESSAKIAFERGATTAGLVISQPLNFTARDMLNLKSLHQALTRLNRLSPRKKRGLIEACVNTVLQDGSVAESEYELFRAIASTIGCPVPVALNSPS